MKKILKPIKSKKQLLQTIKHIHFSCYKLCEQAFGEYFPNSGNIAVFCHSDEEYKFLTNIREELTESSSNPDQKYYRLLEPITVPAQDNVPEATYTHLYIRKPDPTPYGKYTGDVGFFLGSEAYSKLKNSLLSGVEIKGARIYDRPSWDMIQLTDPKIDAVSYVSMKKMTEAVHVKFAAKRWS